jgi:ubiquinone/menaquinone biosynthesis C-methylase UbiE/uncharacterized protein YbaR (Trm112 family)
MNDDSTLSLFCCPACRHTPLLWEDKEAFREIQVFTCSHCASRFEWRDGIFDFLGMEIGEEVITPFQRLMQAKPIVLVYEKLWRPCGFFIASFYSFSRFSKMLLDWINPSSHQLILDLACGPGLFTLPLSQQTNGQIVGFDLSFPMLQQARKRLNWQEGTGPLLLRGTVFRLPFPDSSFDSILCSGALHLFDRPAAALVEISRVLKPGGVFICQTTLKPLHSAGIATFLDQMIRFGFFKSKGEVVRLLEGCKLKIERDWHRRIIYLFLARRL